MNNIKKRMILLFVCMTLGSFAAELLAQESGALQLKGVVKDKYGAPLYGALVSTENGNDKYITDVEGLYNIEIKDGSRFLTFSYVGYKNLKVSLDEVSGGELDVELLFDSRYEDEVIPLGYIDQRRNAIAGAVSTVSGQKLAKSPVANLSQTLAGNLPGLTTIETNSELSRSGVEKYIRGRGTENGNDMLVIIDGVICPNTNYEYISPEEIESVAILKDAASTAMYGILGGNGVLVIETKRGNIGKPRVGVRFDQSFQQMTRRPDIQNSREYAEMRNQAGYNDGLGAYSQFSATAIEKYRAQNDVLYPNNNYYDMFLRDLAFMQRTGIDVSGGSERVKYYSNVNYMHQSLPFKITDEPGRSYDPTPGNHWVNFRSNLDIKINNYLDGFLRLNGNVKSEKRAGSSNGGHEGITNATIYTSLFNLPPTMYGPLTPTVTDENDPGYLYSNQVITHDNEENPTYGILNRSGYGIDIVTNIMAQAGLNLKMDFLTKGLSMSGLFAYQTNSVHTSNTSQDYSLWVRSADESSLTFQKKGTSENTALVYYKTNLFYYNLNVFGNIKYQRMFGDHSIDAMGYAFYLQQERENTGAGNNVLPYKRMHFGASATYGYKDRYFLKGDIGYSGSDAFHKDNRFTTTPAVSAAWVVSKEDFLADVTPLSYLKLRASYGISANDNLGSTRFLYMDDIRTDNNFEGTIGNPKLEAEKMKMWNFGLDFGLFNALNVTFDYFDQQCDNMLVSSSGLVPIYQGTALDYYPKTNTGKMTNKGFEVGVDYRHKINKDWTALLGFSFAQNKNKVISINESPYSDDYAYPYRSEGFAYGQKWGYLIDYSNGSGLFNMQSEIDNCGLDYAFGTPRLGDFIYKDLNGDGIIDEQDQAPIGYSSIPQQYYTVTGGFNYRNFEFSFMFQGTGKVSGTLSGIGAYEYASQGFFTDMHKNAWTEERFLNDQKIEGPALALSQSTSHVENDYYIVDASYLRLRNLEIAYTLPLRLSGKVFADKIRFSLNAQNLFTIDHMPSKYIDPETGSMSKFQPYRVYNAGVSLTF